VARRAGAIALAVAVAVGGGFGLLALIASRDSAPVRHGAPPGPGQAVRGGAPPGLSPALRRALARGDVVFTYGSPAPPAGLRALADDVQGGPTDLALAAAGQAVLLARRPTTTGIVALAWGRRLQARSLTDPALRAFAEFWLGRGRAR
jgi:hypothetical protein